MSRELLDEVHDIQPKFCEQLQIAGWKEKKITNKIKNDKLWDKETLKECLIKINPNANEENIDEAIKKLTRPREGNLFSNKEIIVSLQNGIVVTGRKSERIYCIDYENIENNVFEYANQVQVYEQNDHFSNDRKNKLIPDIVAYLNGIPISIIELKSPINFKENLEDAYKQIINYTKRYPSLFVANLFAVVSDTITTKYGALSAPFASFWTSWKRVDIDSDVEQDVISTNNQTSYNYVKNIQGLFRRHNFLKILKWYTYYSFEDNQLIKYIPKYYQFFGVEETMLKIENNNDQNVGYLWFSQGSGKSVMMVYLAKLISQKMNEKYKVIFITDRNDLDNALFVRLNNAREFLNINPINIKSRKDLKERLANERGFGIYTTTVEKFAKDTGVLCENKNIFLIVDEAHRSHGNIEEENVFDYKTQTFQIKKGFAAYLREAFPNARRIGFTGTPILRGDRTTDKIFGPKIGYYSMDQSVEDGSTVPIHYEERIKCLSLSEKNGEELNELCNLVVNENNECEEIKEERQAYINKKIANFRALFENKNLIENIVKDFWTHYNNTKEILHGKAIFVAFNRKVAYMIYKEMIKQNPEYKDKIILVITKSNKDTDKEMIDAIPNDEEKKEYECEFKKSNSKYKIAIVVDMWTVGFDVKDLDTLYLFKIARLHNLLQTITRVNRTFTDKNGIVKENGLIVDYVGIWSKLVEALKEYSGNYSSLQKNVKNEILFEFGKLCQKIDHEIFDSEYYKLKQNNKNSPKLNDILLETSTFIMDNYNNEKLNVFLNDVKQLNKLYKRLKHLKKENFKIEEEYYEFKHCLEIAKDFNLIKYIIEKSLVINEDNFNMNIRELRKKVEDAIKINNEKNKNSNFNCNINDISTFIEENKKLELNELSSLEEKNNALYSFYLDFSSNVLWLKKNNKITCKQSNNLMFEINDLIIRFNNNKIDNLTSFDLLIKSLFSYVEENTPDPEIKESWRNFATILIDPKYKNIIKSTKIEDMAKDIYKECEKYIKKFNYDTWNEDEYIRNELSSNIKEMLMKKYDFPPKSYNPKNDNNSFGSQIMSVINNLIKSKK